jgi:hypothetical protein
LATLVSLQPRVGVMAAVDDPISIVEARHGA